MDTTEFHLAQVNIGTMLGGSIQDPIMKDFVDQLDDVNAVAEKSVGFVWRLKDDSNNATNIKVFEDDKIIVNLSVWQTVEHLHAFVYQGSHLAVLRRRKEWFSKMKFFMALWYVPVGTIPTLEEARQRLAYLEQHGPTPFAFDFKKTFAPPGKISSSPVLDK